MMALRQPPELRLVDGALPQNLEAEQVVLGSILTASVALEMIGPTLKPDDFYLPVNAAIFAGMRVLEERGVPSDVVTLADYLQAEDKLDDTGGSAYLASLAGMVPIWTNAGHYAAIVRRHADERRVIDITAGAQQAALNGQENVYELARRVAAELQEIAAVGQSKAIPTTAEAIAELMESIESGVDKSPRIDMGLTGLDSVLHGMKTGELIIVGARTSHGKTSLCVSVACDVALRQRIPVIFFTVETDRAGILQKVFSVVSGVPHQRIEDRVLTDNEKRQVREATTRITASGLRVIPANGWDMSQISAVATQTCLGHPVGLIVIDYLQYIKAEERRDNREQQVAAICRAMKGLSVQTGWPVLAPAQVNRAPEGRKDKRPQLTDLRESGSIENDADKVILLYREHEEEDERMPVEPRIAIIAKHRNGVADVQRVLSFVGERMQFVNGMPNQSDDGEAF